MSGPARTVYVSNGRGGTVTPIDTATNTPGEPIEVGVRPRAIVITPDGTTAYVVNQSRPQPPPWHSQEAEKRGLPQPSPDPRGTVTPIDTATNTPGAPIEVGMRPRAIVITPDSRTAYVVNQSRPQPPPWHNYEAEKRGLPQPAPDPRGTVTPVDTATNTPGEPIDEGDEPFAIAVTPDGKTVYVANTWENTGRPASAPCTVTPIATATDTPGAPIEVGRGPWAFAITPDGQTAYVANRDSGTVTPIRIAKGTASAPIPAGTHPYAIAITP